MKLHSQPSRKRMLEATFTEVVRSIDGEVVEELLPSNAAAVPNNADYVLFGRTVIAELKCLQKNFLRDSGVGEKMQRLMASWMRDGILRKEHIVNGQFSTESLPDRCQRQAVAVFAQPLDKALKKANGQIESTRELLELPQARGLFILANDGNYSLYPQLVVSMLRDRLSRDHPAIDSFIYFAPGMEVTAKGVQGAMRFWVDGAARNSLDAVPQELVVKLRSGWITFNGCTEIITQRDLIHGIGFARVESRV